MCFGNLNQLIPIEITSLNIPLSMSIIIMVLGYVELLLLRTVIDWVVERICMFPIESRLVLLHNLIALQGGKKKQDFQLPDQKQSSFKEKTDDGNLCREDVEMVMERLGIVCHSEGEKLQERLGSSDLSQLFEEEPSLDEVKEAFDVFDENRDGFVDARELQRVLRVLGFKEGLEMDKCRRMIGSFDENGDGKIDFNEFLKFMENSFC
uniref:Putative calcium-binding protein CML45 n=1 Tax=Davidia involucrata TaxID=16924 RepID=A0A5B6Z019_DAVIN